MIRGAQCGDAQCQLPKDADPLQVPSTSCLCRTALGAAQISVQNPRHFLQIKAWSWCLQQGCGGQVLPGNYHLSTPGTKNVQSRQDASRKRVFLGEIICSTQQANRPGHFLHFPALDTSHVNIPVNVFSFQLHCL